MGRYCATRRAGTSIPPPAGDSGPSAENMDITVLEENYVQLDCTVLGAGSCTVRFFQGVDEGTGTLLWTDTTPVSPGVYGFNPVDPITLGDNFFFTVQISGYAKSTSPVIFIGS